MRVCVVGGGVSGLVSTKSCLEQGLDVVAYEQDNYIGGIWYYTDELRENQGAAAYHNLLSNTSKEVVCFSDFPFPDETSQYFTHNQALQYLKDYATHFDLWPHIQLETRVIKVERSDDYKRRGRWRVTTQKKGSEDLTTEVFDAVMISTGYFGRPFIPNLPGLNEFPGDVTTAAAYRRGEVFTGQNVLVVGNSFSAGDMASEITHFAKKVYLAVGDGTWVIPYNAGNNLPVDCLGSRHGTYCKSKKASIEGVYQLCNGRLDHVNTGLCSEKSPGETAYMINDELGFLINSSRITVKGHVAQFKGRTVIFRDNSTIGPIDHILLATGYHTEVPYLEKGILPEKKENFRLYNHVFQADLEHPTMAFIGLMNHVGPAWALYELQARWASGVFAGIYHLPDKETMKKEVSLITPEVVKKLTKDLGYPVIYSDTLTKLIGCRPRILKYILTDPVLAYACWFGPMFSAQYRIEGPHRCPGARERFLSGLNRTVTASKTREVKNPFVPPNKTWLLPVGSVCCLVASCIFAWKLTGFDIKNYLKSFME